MRPNMTRKIAKVIAIVLTAALVITSFSFVFLWASDTGTVYATTENEDLYLDQELNSLKEILTNVQINYKDEITYEKLLDGAYQGVFNALDDPYSVYYRTAEESNDFVENVSGEFSGIGVNLENYYGQCRVVAPIPGTPAEKVGIHSGDIIKNVDGVNVSDMTLDEIISLIKGKVGTKVTLTVNRNGTSLSFTMVRETICTTSVEFKMLDGNIGYIRIKQFDKDSHLEFKNAKLQLIAQGAKSFIVDVRNNPGGYVSAATDIAEQFMPKGPIIHFQQKGTLKETVSASGDGDLGKPIVLLVNNGSASASEILAGAWQDSGTAVLVGTTTFGKGVAQQVLEFNNGKYIKLSMYYFLTPKGHVINKVGVSPDFVVENYKEVDADTLTERYKSFAPMNEKNKPKAGDTGLNVYGAQQRLSLLGYEVTVTGVMDDKTVAAVKAIQKNQGLYVYGVLDYATMKAIDQETIKYINGADTDKDLQLEKAIQLLMK